MVQLQDWKGKTKRFDLLFFLRSTQVERLYRI